MLESALIIIVFLPVLVGIVDFGQLLYFNQALAERTRVATRYGAVHTFNATQIANVAIYNDPAGAGNGATPILPYLNTTSGSQGYVSATLSDSGTDDARITVKIADFPMKFFMMKGATRYRTIYDTAPYEIGR